MTTMRAHRTKLVASVAVMLLACGPVVSGTATDNAALLYYQAILLYEKPDETMGNMLSRFSAGKIPANAAIREHVETNRRIVNYIVTAADLPHCDWAYDYSQGFDLALPNLPSMKRLVFLLLSDARLLAQQGDFPLALERCAAAHKMALHAVDRTVITYLVGIATSARTNKTIQEILANVPADAALLPRLKVQLSEFQSAYPSVAWVIAQEGQVAAATIRKEETPTILRMMKEGWDTTENESMTARVREGDEAFFARNRAHWLYCIAALVDTLESGLPYPQMCARLAEQAEQLCDASKDNPDATMTAFGLPAVHRIYQLAVRQQTQFNAVRTAVDLCLAKAATGQLPDALPAGAPGDLFSGKPFEYEKTQDGFLLRCRVKENPDKAEVNQYEFRLP
jgi:hypothetical protein